MTREDLLKLSRREPIDGTEISWWRLLDYDDDIEERRAVYHVSTSWKNHPWSVGSDTVGADLVDVWAIEQRYRGEDLHPIGRAVGWTNFLVGLAHDDSFMLSVTEAEVALRRRIRDRLDRMRVEYKRLEDHLSRLEVTTWPRALVLDKFPLVYHGDPVPKGDPT